MKLENDIQKLIYFAQAILDRNAYYVEDHRQEALTLLHQRTIDLKVPFLEFHLLFLYRVFSIEKPESWTHSLDNAKPTPVWEVSKRTEDVLVDFISVLEIVLHILRKGRE